MRFRCSVCDKVMQYHIECSVGSSNHHIQCECGTTFVVNISAHKEDNRDKGYRDADTLRSLYEEQGKTMQQLAWKYAVSPMTINLWLKKHGIATRRRGRVRRDN